jgi:hypothetical protein
MFSGVLHTSRHEPRGPGNRGNRETSEELAIASGLRTDRIPVVVENAIRGI